MKRGLSVESVLKPLSDCPCQVYMGNLIQVPDIMDWALPQVGTAEVWLTSFSVSEEFLRRLFFLRQRRSVSQVHLVLDFKATQKTLKLLPFMRNAVNSVHLTDNHSKIMLIRGGNDILSVVTSQNLTRGNRIEAAVISTDSEIFNSLMAGVRDIITNKSVSLDDLF